MKTILRKSADLLFVTFLVLILTAYIAEACSKVPVGWKLETQKTSGALCADVLLKADQEGTRKLRVFESNKPAFETDDAALCKNCGGTSGDPFEGIKWLGTTLSVSNSGGSRERWSETWKFAKRDNRWIIIGWDRSVTDGLTGSVWLESVNAITGKANARHVSGTGACEDSNSDECRKSRTKTKVKKLACAHQAKTPDVGTVQRWRDQKYACGMETP